MPSLFRHHGALRLFVDVSRFGSFSEAADAMNMTKGAISYQMKQLEADLGFALFERSARGVTLTAKGRRALEVSTLRYGEIEAEISVLKGPQAPTLTVGVSSYFASRWLSPRLMTFMQRHPDIQLRIQPMTKLFELERQGVDIAIRWGHGHWLDVEVTPVLAMPAWPVGDSAAAARVAAIGLAQAFAEFTLLRDHDDSNAWSDWYEAAGLAPNRRADTLIIPDPNVRTQAVIDGQGVALMDMLTAREMEDGRLIRLSEIELSSYGYFLARPPGKATTPAVEAFVDWLREQVENP